MKPELPNTKTIGFFDPDELITVLHLEIAKVYLAAEEYDTAEVHLKSPALGPKLRPLSN